ncbi:MAG: biotin--[acetyl-CoA-carboxylase] ligase [Planctomycetaceae bacterium]|nr:biotin--[acetyl-CoA-carboxylase] ligase [Planctomycetaceae bacterium]
MSEYRPLEAERIENARKEAAIGRKIVVFKSTASTNDIAWQYANRPANHGLCVLAESQTRGRGRRGRKWYGSPGQSILCSILLLRSSLESELLTLAAVVAAAEAVRQFCHVSCRIKWPNDLLIADKKLAGILVEKKTVKNKQQFVIGIGINCSQEQAHLESRLHNSAVSLKMATGRDIDRSGLVCELLGELEFWLERPANEVIDKWLQLSGMLGLHLCVECDGKTYRGTCRGIDPVQGLILQLDRGPIRFFPAGQTSICT